MSSTGGIGDAVSGSGHGRLLPPDPALPSGVEAVRSVVRTLARAGADVIKCATTGGASSRPGHGPFDSAFGRDEMEALVAEAQAVDRPVVCHALGGEGLRVAVEAGSDSIEHGCYLGDEPELIARMADRGSFFAPTLTVYEFHRESQSPHVRERALALQRPHTESVQRALAAGVRMVAGTDVGGHEHGINEREIVLLEQAGLTPMQAIQAATGWAAECLGLGSEIGTVEPGELADMITVGGNPLEDIAVLEDHQRIALVIKGGTVHVDRRERDSGWARGVVHPTSADGHVWSGRSDPECDANASATGPGGVSATPRRAASRWKQLIRRRRHDPAIVIRLRHSLTGCARY